MNLSVRKKHLLSTVFAGVAIAIVSQDVALAQVDSIVVTAQRKEENLSDVPIPVSAFGEDQIKNLQIDEPVDIGDSVPNLRIQPVTANGAAIQIHMRGASIQNSGFNTSESPVGIYVDDVYYGRLSTANLDLNDIERIEVLRGPQGTLYGRNTIAGAIKFVSRTPADDPWLRASVGYGAFETVQAKASVGGPLVEGSLGASLAAVYTNRSKGWQDNPNTGSNPGEFENIAGRLKLHYYGHEKFSAKFQFMISDSNNDGSNLVPYAPFVGPGSVPGAPVSGFYSTLTSSRPSFGDAKQWSASADLTYDFSDNVRARSITAYSDNEDSFGFDLAGGGVDVGAPGMPFYVDGLFISSTSDNQTFSQELQLLGTSFDDRMEWLLGFYYLNESGSQNYTGDLSALGFGFLEDSNQDTNSYSFFAEATYNLTDNFAIIGGVRYTVDDKEFDLTCTNLTGAFFGCIPGSGTMISLGDKFKEPTFKGGLRWNVSDTALLYATYSEGFQAGGFQTLCFGDTICASEIYDPQTVQNIELGYKGGFADNRIRLNLAGFYAMYDDIQQSLVGASGFPTANVGEVDVYGIELESTIEPVDGLSIFGNVGLLESDYGTLNPAATASPSNELPAAPGLSYRVGFNYQNNIGSKAKLNLGLDYSRTSEYFSEVTNALPIDAFGRLNGIISISSENDRYSLSLTGKNLTDEEIVFSGIVQPGFTNVRQVLPPREWMLTLSVQY